MNQFLVILTVFLTLTFSTLAVLIVKKKLDLELKNCLNHSILTNQKRRQSIQQLFAQNNKAKALRIKRQIAEKAYRTAPTPSTRAAALAVLQSVKGLQKILRTYQKAIISKMKFENHKTKVTFLKNGYQTLNFTNSTLVKPYPQKSDSPSYKMKQNFTHLSKVKIRKQFRFNQLKNHQINTLLKKQKGELTCGSALITKNQKLEIKLLGGRSF